MLSRSTICSSSQVMGLDWPSSRSNPGVKHGQKVGQCLPDQKCQSLRSVPMFQETLGALVSAVLIEMWTMMGGLVMKEPSIAWNSTLNEIKQHNSSALASSTILR